MNTTGGAMKKIRGFFHFLNNPGITVKGEPKTNGQILKHYLWTPLWTRLAGAKIPSKPEPAATVTGRPYSPVILEENVKGQPRRLAETFPERRSF